MELPYFAESCMFQSPDPSELPIPVFKQKRILYVDKSTQTEPSNPEKIGHKLIFKTHKKNKCGSLL